MHLKTDNDLVSTLESFQSVGYGKKREKERRVVPLLFLDFFTGVLSILDLQNFLHVAWPQKRKRNKSIKDNFALWHV